MNFIKSLLLIVIVACVMLATSLLLDLAIISSEISRQLIIYLLMAVEFYIGCRFYFAINK